MDALLGVIIKEIPGIIDMVKARHVQVNPDLPPLTDAEAAQMLKDAIDSSLAKDDAWQAAHKQP